MLIGIGVAIGSGIFRTPGDVASRLSSPWLILAAWSIGGLIVLMQGMVTAELGTRFPKAGGEYVFLKEAYGEFAAFLFGWAYTIFIIGGGAAAIALAFGDFSTDLFALTDGWTGPLAASSIVAVTMVNAVGLRLGAGAQNVLTAIKVIALLAFVAAGMIYGSISLSPQKVATSAAVDVGIGPFIIGLLPVLWSYEGTTDSVKMAEEISDVRRALPRALIGSAIAVTLLYLLVNVALMRVLAPAEMNGVASAPGEAMGRLFGPKGRNAVLLAGMFVCLGSLSSTVLATIRVTFALARDGLTFRFLSRMSKAQAPVPALMAAGGFAVILVLYRRFEEALGIYFFAGAILFASVYASLIVFRLREAGFPKDVYRCPWGIAQALVLIVIQMALAANIARVSPRDAAYTALLLVFIVGLYWVWPRRRVS